MHLCNVLSNSIPQSLFFNSFPIFQLFFPNFMLSVPLLTYPCETAFQLRIEIHGHFLVHAQMLPTVMHRRTCIWKYYITYVNKDLSYFKNHVSLRMCTTSCMCNLSTHSFQIISEQRGWGASILFLEHPAYWVSTENKNLT